MSDLAHKYDYLFSNAFYTGFEYSVHQLSTYCYAAFGLAQDAFWSVSTSLIAFEYSTYYETLIWRIPKAIVSVWTKTAALLFSRRPVATTVTMLTMVAAAALFIKGLQIMGEINYRTIEDFKNVDLHGGYFSDDDSEENRYELEQIESDEISSTAEEDSSEEMIDRYLNDSHSMNSSSRSSSSEGEKSKDVDTCRYLNHQNFHFIKKQRLDDMHEYIQHYRNNIFQNLVMQTKKLGQFGIKVEFLREEPAFRQRDYRPDINSNGPLKHKHALQSTYRVTTYYLDYAKITFYGLRIQVPIKRVYAIEREITMSNSLVQNNAGTRTISPHKTEEQARVAITSVITNSTTVNQDKGQISKLLYLQEGTVEFLMFLYHHQAHIGYKGALDFQ